MSLTSQATSVRTLAAAVALLGVQDAQAYAAIVVLVARHAV